MGAKFVKTTDVGTAPNTYNVGCTVDADCYKELKTTGGAVIRAAITDAATKAKTCCLYYEVTKAPSGTAKATGDATLALYKTAYGTPTAVGESTKYCQGDYPTFISTL